MLIYDKNWNEFLIPYEQAVNELILKFNSIKEQCYKSGQYSLIENVYGRVKSVSSILEKSQKKGYNIDDLPIRMTDIAGIRIICQFEQDIEAVVDMIKQREDMNVEIFKDYLKNPKESGYKSAHLIVSYNVHTAFGIKKVFCEIQIRTLAMDFWATIEHSLNYKYKGQIPKDVSLRLKNAAKGVYKLDEEMSLIKEDVTSAQQLFRSKSSATRNVVGGIARLNKLGYTELAKKYADIFSELQADESPVQLVLLNKEIEREIEKIIEQ